MTDAELIQLVEDKLPEELSSEEIRLLRQRLPASPELRGRLVQQVEMNRYLADVLGHVNLSVDDIFVRAAQRSQRYSAISLTFGWGLCLLLLVGGAVLYAALRPPPIESKEAVPAVAQLADQPSEPTSEAAGTNDEKGASNDSFDEEPTAIPAAENPPAGELPGEDVQKGPSDEMISKTAADKSTRAEEPRVSDDKATEAAARAKGKAPPWLAEDQLGGEVQPLADAAFLRAAAPRDPLGVGESRQWLGAAPGEQHTIRADRTGVRISGLLALRAPWPDDAVLHLSLRPRPGFKMHFWHGRQGVTLGYFPQEKPKLAWAGYAVTRKGRQSLPDEYALSASDYGRAWRTGALLPSGEATLEIRHQAGSLLFCYGDICLLSAPLPAAPSEVYLEGDAAVDDVRMFRSTPLAGEVVSPRPSVVDHRQPATLAWHTNLPRGASLQKLADGRAQLVAPPHTSLALAAIGLPAVGLAEVVFEIDGASPGAGVYLGDAQGEPLAAARFLVDPRTQRTHVRLHPIGDRSTTAAVDARHAAAAFIGKHGWLRLVYSAGVARLWTSVDGAHWGQAGTPLEISRSRAVRSIGLVCAPADVHRSIAVRRIQIRPFPAVYELADRALVEQAPAAATADPVSWVQAVESSRPSGVDLSAWRVACAVRGLSTGAHGKLAHLLAEYLLSKGASPQRSLEDRLAFLDEMAEAMNLWHRGEGHLAWSDFQPYYTRLGNEQLAQGNLRPFGDAAKHALRVPAWAADQEQFFDRQLARTEMLALVHAGQWKDVARFSDELTAFHAPSLDTLIAWARWQAAGHLADGSQFAPRSAQSSADWRHPLKIDVSKEGYNILAEIEAALDGEAYLDACQIITSTRPSAVQGLLPDAHDARLSVSLPVAVAAAVRDQPRLAAAMVEGYEPLGRLRVRDAIRRGDIAAVENVTVQFFGTAAAADARLWLGDRALSSGDFAAALAHFRRADAGVDAKLERQIAARERLAAAWLGEEAGAPLTREVDLAGRPFSAEQFESLVADALQRAPSGVNLSNSSSREARYPTAMPAAQSFQAEQRTAIDGAMGNYPERVPGDLITHDVDWVARQLGWAQAGDLVLINNGFAVTALDAATAARRWHTTISDNVALAHAWSLTPTWPVVSQGKIYARVMKKTGPSLVCLDAASGQILWNDDAHRDLYAISDPVVLGGELLMVQGREFGREFIVRLVAYDARTGEIRRNRQLMRFDASWHQHRTCSVAIAGDSLLVAAGGGVLCCDAEGTVRWARRSTWMPTEVEPQWFQQHSQPPFVAGESAYVVQPGVASLDCLRTASGRLRWSRALPGVRRILGACQDILVVEAEDGLLGFDAQSGQLRWRHESGPLLHAAGTSETSVVYARRQPGGDQGRFVPQLVWLDAATGRATASTTLDALAHAEPFLGPFIPAGDRIWALAGAGIKDPRRNLVELVPSGQPGDPPTELARR